MSSLGHYTATAGRMRELAASMGVVNRYEPAAPSSTLRDPDLAVLIQDTELADVTVKLFIQGHYALAVEQAYKCVDRRVSLKSGLDNFGKDLMMQALSADKPRLRFNDMNSLSDRNEQEGFRFIFAGCMMAIRNPRAHDHLYLDERSNALLMIAWADFLLRMVEEAEAVDDVKT